MAKLEGNLVVISKKKKGKKEQQQSILHQEPNEKMYKNALINELFIIIITIKLKKILYVHSKNWLIKLRSIYICKYNMEVKRKFKSIGTCLSLFKIL